MKRRNFLKSASLTGLGLAVGSTIASCVTEDKKEKKAIAIATPVYQLK